MLAPIWLRAAYRGVPTFLVTALLLGQSSMALAESPAQRQELDENGDGRLVPSEIENATQRRSRFSPR